MSEQTNIPAALAAVPAGYADWLAELKSRIRAAQQRASLDYLIPACAGMTVKEEDDSERR